MARLENAPEVAKDLDCIVDYLVQYEAADISDRIAALSDAISILEQSPLIGRPARSDLRELIVGRGSEGCVILYRFVPEIDTALVLAERGQREAGYAQPSTDS